MSSCPRKAGGGLGGGGGPPYSFLQLKKEQCPKWVGGGLGGGWPPISFFLVKKRTMPNVFRFHGNYVGPGWSAGRYQNSVVSDVPAVDEFDATGKKHDAAYAMGKNLAVADFEFASENFGKGAKRTVAAVAVGAQGVGRVVENLVSGKSSMPTEDFEMRGRSASRPRTPASLSRSRSAPRAASRGVVRRRSPSSAFSRTVRRRVTRRRPQTRRGRRVVRRRRVWFARRGRRSTVNGALKYGCVQTFETGGMLNTKYCQYIGHASMPTERVQQVMWLALTKKLLEKVGMVIKEPTQAVDNIGVGDKILVHYQSQPTSGVVYREYTIIVSDSLVTIAKDFYDFFIGTQTNQLLYLKMTYAPAAATTVHWPRTVFNLQTAMLHLDFKSDLKVQNRSIVDSTDDEVSVDNVPLIGRYYEGNGNGTEIPDSAIINSQALFGNQNSGMIGYSAVGPMNEPLVKSQAINAKKSGGLQLASGQIKQSTLHTKMVIRMNNLVTKMGEPTLTPSQASKVKMGKFRIMALEKAIETDFLAAVKNITLAYENNIRSACYVTGGYPLSQMHFVPNGGTQ